MPQVSVTDLIDQSSFTRDSSGIKAVRKFLVEDLSEVGHKRLFQAATLPDVPTFGQPHPGIPGLVATSINAVPVGKSPSKAWIIVGYESPTQNTTTPSPSAPPTIEVGSSLSVIETSTDKDGEEMILNHSQTSTNEDGERITTELPPQPGKAAIQEPNPYFTMGRREPSPFDFQNVLLYVGRVNQTSWFNSPPRTWLCAAIRATLDGDAFQVAYEFQYRSRTWDIELVYTDPSTGAPVANAVPDVGRKTFRLYPEIDFNGLSLGV